MRPSLRRNFLRLIPIAIVAACALLPASSATGLTLYDGNYSTDLSSSTPGGLAPANGVTLPYPTSSLHLSWDPVPGANRYQVQVARQSATNADCSDSSAFQLDNITVTADTDDNEWVPSLDSSATGKDIWVGAYCWRVRTTGKGYGEWSSAHRFTRTWSSSITGLKFFNDHDGPIPRTTSSPDWSTGSTVTRNAGYVEWDELPGAATYQVQVSPTRSFAREAIITDREGIGDNRALLLHLPDDTYYWRVRAIAPNGTEGGWSVGPNAFTVRWQDPTWSSDARLYPADSSTQSEFRIGWTPMPGASHYEVQVGTSAGCFWNPDYPQYAPIAYGAWVNYMAIHDDSDPPVLQSTFDPSPNHCRLSDIRTTTMNNWMTLDELIGDDAWANINRQCFNVDSGMVECEPAVLPTAGTKSYGAIYQGALETPGGADDGATGNGYDLYWRVRPVYEATQDWETGWDIADTGFKAYGSWTRYTNSGANRHHKYTVDRSTAPNTSTDTRCDGPMNPGSGCLEHVGTSMQAGESPAVTYAPDMRFPVFVWRPFAGVGGYILEVARDPLFNNIASTRTIGAGYQQSYAYTHSFTDNSEDTGFWWRVTPCNWEWDPIENAWKCLRIYAADSAGLPSSYGLGGYVDNAVAQEFQKESAVKVEVVPGFEGAAPMLRWTRSDVASTDYAGWSQGLAGAEYYELQLARDPFFSQGTLTINTTIPRAVPFTPGDSAGENTALPDGLWYYRVRAVIEDDVYAGDLLHGAWSDVGTFNKRIDAPVPQGANGASGAGVVVAWSPIEGAGSYEIQWTDESGFEKGATSAVTQQTTHRIPASDLGRRYWRVRAIVNGVNGQWSGQVRYVTIVPPTTIRYGLNRTKILARTKLQITGELKVAGAARNNERLRLQRKTGGCDNTRGRYVDSSVAVTGQEADDGMVNIPARLVQNTCFRFSWTNGSSVRYSAPIEAKVVPYTRVFKNRKVVRRSKPMCVTIRANVLINGRARVQYRVGKRWRTARSMMMRNKRAARTCVRFTKAGRYPTRVYFDKMYKRRQGWVQYENVMRGMGMVRVNDVWRVVRSR